MPEKELEGIRDRMELLTQAGVELLNASKEKLIERLKASGVKIDDPPETVDIDGTVTVIGTFKDERLNIAIGTVSDIKKFDTLTIGDRVVWVRKGASLKVVKRKILEERKPKTSYRKPQLTLIPEMRGLEKFIGETEMEDKGVSKAEEKEKEEGDNEKLPPSEIVQNRALKQIYGV